VAVEQVGARMAQERDMPGWPGRFLLHAKSTLPPSVAVERVGARMAQECDMLGWPGRFLLHAKSTLPPSMAVVSGERPDGAGTR